MGTLRTIYILVFFMVCLAKTSNGQIVIGKPTLGFSQACASPSFNTYNVTFTFSPDTGIISENQFIIELSDATGSFAEPEVIFTSAAGSVTESPATLSFEVPTTISGEAYKIRIKSTVPAASSTGSNAFAAYYKIQDTPFSINNLVETASFCAGGSYLLAIDNPGSDTNDSPLQYPSLTFNWYKETSPTTADFVAEGPSLSVSEEGTYFVETNYGTCTSNSFSNRVTVTSASSEVSGNIDSSLGNPFCATNGPTTLSTIQGDNYQWFKDGAAIEGANGQTYETNDAGSYSVNVELGTCTASATIELDNSGFTSELNVQEDNIIDEGQTIDVTVTTTAQSPEFIWYLNDIVIPNADEDNYSVTRPGTYKVDVNQTVGCITTQELIFNVREAFPNVTAIPNVISPNGDGINDTWIIPQIYVQGTGTNLTIINTRGEVELQTDSYLNNWPEDTIDLTGGNLIYYYIIETSEGETKKGTISVFK